MAARGNPGGSVRKKLLGRVGRSPLISLTRKWPSSCQWTQVWKTLNLKRRSNGPDCISRKTSTKRLWMDFSITTDVSFTLEGDSASTVGDDMEILARTVKSSSVPIKSRRRKMSYF